jgi:ribosome biogenesis protein MAK21
VTSRQDSREASIDTLGTSEALKAAYELLAAKLELEVNCGGVVSKLGDPPEEKIARTSGGYLISCLLTQHPVMGLVVVREIEQFLFRCVSWRCLVSPEFCLV